MHGACCHLPGANEASRWSMIDVPGRKPHAARESVRGKVKREPATTAWKTASPGGHTLIRSSATSN